MVSAFAREAGPLIGIGVGAVMTGASLLWPNVTGPFFFYGGLGLVALGSVLWVLGRWLRPRPKPARPITPAKGVDVRIDGSSNTTTAAGRDVHITNPPAAEKEFAAAPHLLWSGARVVTFGQAYEVIVACHSVGPTALVRPDGTWVRSIVDVLGPPILGTSPVQAEVTQQREAIEFVDFDIQGPIRTGAFDLRMRCQETDPIPGEREVTWRVTYTDDDLERGYVTECSATVVFVGFGEPRVIGLPALDNTSRKTRNDDYNVYMQGKKESSTGPRRAHEH
jgi:hypothetical protein